MRRDCPVWIEAYQVYLEAHCTKEELRNMCFNEMSDEEISKVYFQYVEEKGVLEESHKWVMEYCRHWM